MKLLQPIIELIYKSELYILCALILSWLMMYFDLPYGNILVVLGFSIASLGYVLTAYAIVPSENGIAKFASKLAGISSCISSVGILYSIMHWPGNEPLLYAGSSGLLISLLILLSFITKGQKELPYQETMSIRLTFLLIGAIVCILMPLFS